MSNTTDFIAFISDVTKPNNERLAEDLLSQKNAEDLYAFFQKNRYTDIPKEACPGILDAMEKLREVRTASIPKKGEPACPPAAGY